MPFVAFVARSSRFGKALRQAGPWIDRTKRYKALMLTLITAPRIRVLFVLALAVTLFFALVPHPPRLPVDALGDKFEHMMAFAVLAFLARLGFRAPSDWAILIRLSVLGAAIELLQALPLVHRDCDWHDWLADTVAAGAALLFVRILRVWDTSPS